jgi:alkylhydroperoxidase family enzyme
MNRIKLPTPDQIPTAALSLLDAVKKQLGMVPNLMKILSISLVALEGYLHLNEALSKGKLDAKTRERIALAIAEIVANRSGVSSDPKAAAAVYFATRVVQERGHVSDADFNAVKAAGYTQAEIVEMFLHVAFNSLTNFINVVVQTEVDFPMVNPLSRTAA